jgi:imidazolonepropionase-like amidohydrolase
VNREPYHADLLIQDGKIVSIGSGFDDSDVIDAAGKNIYPGFVEAHCHLGLDGYGIGVEGKDYNELGDICTPQMRAIDSFNPFDPSVGFAAKAGELGDVKWFVGTTGASPRQYTTATTRSRPPHSFWIPTRPSSPAPTRSSTVAPLQP